MTTATPDPAVPDDPANEVHLLGRVSAVLDERVLPSGDVVRPVRVVVPRPARDPTGTAPRSRTVVDVIDVACWSASTRSVAAGLAPGDHVRVTGSLHRRFFRAGPGVQSRYEVRADQVRPVPADRGGSP